MKKIIPILAAAAFISVAPGAVLADDAETATTTDFSVWTGLQMPESLPMQDESSVTGVTGTSSDGLLIFLPFPAGPRLIKAEGSETVYWVSEQNFKIAIPSQAVFDSYGNKDADVTVVSQEEADYYPSSRFIRLGSEGVIYRLLDGTKRPISSEAWNGSGVDAKEIMDVNKTELNSYPTGAEISSSAELE